jgi:hypothetical protein
VYDGRDAGVAPALLGFGLAPEVSLRPALDHSQSKEKQSRNNLARLHRVGMNMHSGNPGLPMRSDMFFFALGVFVY